ncbi:MAG: GtrA family protein [Bacilli bacterium]|nr:GtrA family protein [Bacilli bacterium]
MIEKLKQNKLVKQILKFGVVGGIAFLIDYLLLYACTEFLNIYYLYSSIISFTVSVIFNYVASVKWVFEVDKDGNKKKEFILFIVFSVMGLGINQAIMWGMSDKMHIYYMFSKIVATFVVMCWNFITRKIFLEKKEK